MSWTVTKLDHFDGNPTFDPIYGIRSSSYDDIDGGGEFFTRDEQMAELLMMILNGSLEPGKFQQKLKEAKEY